MCYIQSKQAHEIDDKCMLHMLQVCNQGGDNFVWSILEVQGILSVHD